MNESRKVINAGIEYTIGNILIKGISFLTIPLYTRLMSTSEYGVYNTYIAYVGIVAFLVCLGLDPTLKNAEIDYPNQKKIYLSTIYCLTFVSFLAVLILVLTFGKWVGIYLNMEWILLILLVLNAETTAIVNICNIELSLNFSSKNYLKISFFQTVTGIFLSVLLMLTLYREKRYMGRIIGTLLPALLVSGVIVTKTVFRLPREKRFDFGMAKYSLRLGLPLVPHLLSQILNAQFDRIMISSIIGYSESGIYSFACNIAIIFQIVYQSFDTVWSPWFFKRMAEKNYDAVLNISKKYILLGTFFAMGLMTISREFIALFSAKEYWEGMQIAPVLILGYYFLFLYTLPTGVEYYTKNTKYMAFGSVVTAIVNIILNYIGIYKFGYGAAAYTTLASYILLFALHWNIYRKIFPQKIFDLKYISGICGIMVIWTVFCIGCQNMWALRYILFSIVAVVIIFFFRKEILEYIKNK